MTEKKTGLAAALGESFDPWAAVGGVRGLIETTLPSLMFLVVFLTTRDLLPSVIAPLVVAGILMLVRVLQRIDVMPALGGFLGLVVSALWAWRTGEASNYFAVGLLTNLAYFAGLLLSLLVRYPILGLLVGFLRGDALGWRKDPTQRVTRKRYTLITWLWTALFAARLLVQAPLYFADATTALAVTRLVMGPFLYAAVAWFTWMLVRNLPPVPSAASVPNNRSL